MRKRQIGRAIIAPMQHRVGHAFLARLAQMPRLRILPYQQDKFQIRQMLENLRAPGRRAFLARRQVPALVVKTRKTEPHGHDGDAAFIVKRVTVHPHPFAQPVAARIVEGNARRMHPRARRLARHANARAFSRADDGARLMRQRFTLERIFGAKAAGPNLRQQTVQRCGGGVFLAFTHAANLDRRLRPRTSQTRYERASYCWASRTRLRPIIIC